MARHGVLLNGTGFPTEGPRNTQLSQLAPSTCGPLSDPEADADHQMRASATLSEAISEKVIQLRYLIDLFPCLIDVVFDLVEPHQVVIHGHV